MSTKLLSSLFTTILVVTTSQGKLMESETVVDNNNMSITMSQGAITMAQPVTNANLRLVLDNVNSTYEGSMNATTSEDLDFQVKEGSLIPTNEWEGHPNHDAADISIYDSSVYAQEPLGTADLNSLELNDTVATSNGTSVITELAIIKDLSYDPNIQHYPDDNDSVFISGGNSNKVSDVVSMPKPPKDTKASLVSLVLSSLNISTVRAEKTPVLDSSSLSCSDN